MLLTLVVSFTLASVALELLVVRHVPPLWALVKRYRLVGVALSVALSWLLGHVFGAAGTIVLIGSVASSVLTQPIYDFARRVSYVVRHLKRVCQRSLDALRRWQLLLSRIYRGLYALRRRLEPPK